MKVDSGPRDAERLEAKPAARDDEAQTNAP